MKWLLIDRGDDTVTRTDDAPDLVAARALLRPREHQYVISAASHALGYSKRLGANRCTSCGLRDRITGYVVCGRCRYAHRRAAALGDFPEERVANGQTRLEKSASQRRWRVKRRALRTAATLPPETP